MWKGFFEKERIMKKGSKFGRSTCLLHYFGYTSLYNVRTLIFDEACNQRFSIPIVFNLKKNSVSEKLNYFILVRILITPFILFSGKNLYNNEHVAIKMVSTFDFN